MNKRFNAFQHAQQLRAEGTPGARQEAITLCDSVLDDDPLYAATRHLRALLHYESGRLAQALADMQEAIAQQPQNADWQNDLAGLYHLAGQSAQAVTRYEAALRLAPDNAQTHFNLGCTLQAQRQLQQAEASYRRALALSPGNATFLCNLGGCLQEAGQIEAAIEIHRAALAIDDGNVNVLNNLGLALQSQGRINEAMDCFHRAIDSNPQHAKSFVNLGMAHYERGDLEQAAAMQRRAISAAPNLVEAHFSLGVALHALCRSAEAVACYRRALAIDPSHVKSFDNLVMTMQFVPEIDADALFAAHLAYAAQFETPLKPFWPKHGNAREPDKRLKVGYVSGDFRTHAVAYFIEPILALHDRTQVEAFCYANQRKSDAVTERLRHLADHWLDCIDLDDDELAQQIMRDGIDILIDLSGHTSHNRLLTFARKPAPLQATYIGYLSTSGLSAMDYRLTDRIAEPADSERYYSETLRYLPDSMWCFQAPEDDTAITPLPALTNGYLTFGSFNNVDKLDATSIELWAALLHRLPDARLLMLAAPQTHPHFLQQFAKHGIPASRLDFRGKIPPQEFRKLLQTVDIALDSFPVNGATTTCECLWQGLPVLSLAGPRFLSRNGQSLLHAARMPDFAAQSKTELINMAALLAGNLPLLNNIRQGMRTHLIATPLMDTRRFVGHLENVYREIWRRWCSGLA